MIGQVQTKSLLVAFQLKAKHVLVVGGGEVALSRIQSLIPTGAYITIISDSVSEDIVRLYKEHSNNVNIHDKVDVRYESFDTADLEKYSLVFTCLDDRLATERIYHQFKNYCPINCADVPEYCDFYCGSTITKGPLEIMVSTNGFAPRLASRIRKDIESSLDENHMQRAVENVGALRQLLRKKTVPENATGNEGYDKETVKTRMGWVSQLCDTWTFNQLANLDHDGIEFLVDSYPTPITFDQFKAR